MPVPPYKSLKALEAVVRHRSVSAAAAELGVTQPAVSQQIRVIENHFDRQLIERGPAGLQVSTDVARYATRLRQAIEEIQSASLAFEYQSRDAERVLTIAVLATFAQRWLIPRLTGFQDQYPEIDIRLVTTSRPHELVRDDVDLSIRCGDGVWSSHVSDFLVPNRIFPVASESYLNACPIKRADDLRQAVLIRVETTPRHQDWTAWFEAANVAVIEPRAWQTYSSSTQAIEAAIAGMGVAMVHTPFVTDCLANGQLTRPFAEDAPDEQGDYYLVYRDRSQIPKRIALFRDWLLQAGASNQNAP